MTFSELSSREHRRLAELLDRARGARRTLEPLTRTYPELTLEDAGHVRDALVDRRLAAGETLVGVIAAAGPEGPFTWLTDGMLAASGAVAVAALQRPQVTPRYALWVGDDEILGCLELCDQPFGEQLAPSDGVAANGGTVRIVVGAQVVARPRFEVDGRPLPLAANGERDRLRATAPSLLSPRLPARALVVSAPLAAPVTLRSGSSARLTWSGGEAVWIEAT
jgi:2-keto-4-pentenoate hydratase